MAVSPLLVRVGGSPGCCADARCCTTDHHKTHGTGAIDEATVAYGWHPWSEKRVRVHELIVRASGAIARCSRIDTPVARTQEIPLWMLDAAACGCSRATKEATTSLAALTTLQRLLSEAIVVTEVSSREDAIASRDHHRGDRHGAPPSPAADTEPSARSFRGDSLISAQPGGRMEQAAGSDPTGGDQLDDAPAGRTRCRGGSAGERRG